jgi:predicted P-loop ATPase
MSNASGRFPMAKKPEWLSDEDWAVFKREHNLTDDDDGPPGAAAVSNVTPFPKGRKRKPPPPPPPGGWPPWHPLLRRDDRGRVIPDLRNVLIALRGEQSIAYGIAFDEMLQRALVTRIWPHAAGAQPIRAVPHEIGDDDLTRLQEWLQAMAIPRVGRETVSQAVEAVAREHCFHPVRDWLRSLEWDGVPRLGSWLHVCLGTPDDEYHRQIGSLFVIAMAARIFEPGCKCDYMLVLEGPQGEEKSKFCRALAGSDAFFSEHLPRIHGDQVRLSMHLRGHWLIEVAELAAMLKGDPEGTKDFISRRIEKYTPKYGRGEVTEPRQCLFIGTTNEDDYIRDVTGGRRYWPVRVIKIDLAALEAIRDELFAEAVAAYDEGKPWWPDRQFEKETIIPIQDDRQFEDALAEQVFEKLEGLTEITLGALGIQLGFDNTKFDMAAQKRVASILRKAGWRKSKRNDRGNKWLRPEKTRFCSNCGALEGTGCACDAPFR